MSKTNDTSRDELTINDLNRELRDDELDEMTGGLQVCATGAHYKTATMEVRETRTPVAYFGGIPIY